MIELRNGTIGQAKRGCQILDMTGDIGSPDDARKRLAEIGDRVYMSGECWGGESDSVIVVIDKDSEPYAAALGMEAIAVRDEWPIAALLVADQDLEHAVCVYPGDSGMSIGEQRPYDSGDAETTQPAAAPSEQPGS